jgi:hypothetical protein
MDRIGDILVARRVITREQLAKALHVQSRMGGPLGSILVQLGLVAQTQIDGLWIESTVTPALEAAIDEASGGRFTKQPSRGVNYTKVLRRDLIVQDMLAGARLIGTEQSVEFTCTLQVGGLSSLALSGTLNCDTRLCELTSESAISARRWLEMIERKAAA